MQYLTDDLVIFYLSMNAILASAFLSDFLFSRWLIKREVTPAADAKREMDLAPAGLSAFGVLIAVCVLGLLMFSFPESFILTLESNSLFPLLLVAAILSASYCGGRLAYATMRPSTNENPFVLDDSRNEQSEHKWSILKSIRLFISISKW